MLGMFGKLYRAQNHLQPPPVMFSCNPAFRANKLESISSPGGWWNGQRIMMQVEINYLNILGVFLVDLWTMSDRFGELYGA